MNSNLLKSNVTSCQKPLSDCLKETSVKNIVLNLLEGCKEVIKYAFEVGNMHRIEADCFENNYASDKILRKKLLMDFEGVLTNHAYNNATGKVMSFKFFGITKKQYLDRCKNY